MISKPVSKCPLCSNEHHHFFSEVQSRIYRICPDCGLIFLSPEHRLDRDSERSRYLLHENDPEDPAYRKFLNRLAEPLSFKLKRGFKGLDYGSGPGPTLAVMFGERGFKVRNYDPFFASDPAALKRQYDFITCTETLEHFHHPGSELEKLNGMLKRGGWLGIMTEILDADDRFVNWHYPREPTHVCFFKKGTMDWIGRRFGWETEHPAKNVVLFRKT